MPWWEIALNIAGFLACCAAGAALWRIAFRGWRGDTSRRNKD